MIRIRCASCDRPLGLDDSSVGKEAFCPACGFVFRVPAPAVLLDALATGPGEPSPPRSQTPAEKSTAAHSTLLPEGPIPLVGDRPDARGESELRDPWRLADPAESGPNASSIPALTPTNNVPSSGASPASPAPDPPSEGVNWSFLSLEPAPAEDIELSIVEDLAAAGIPIDEAPLDVPADVPAPPATGVPPEPPDSASPPVHAPESEVTEVTDADVLPRALPEATPVSPEAAQELLQAGDVPLALPVPLAVPLHAPAGVVWAEPVIEPPKPAKPTIEWDEVPRAEDPSRLAELLAPRSKRKPDPGAISLIPGWDDFYVGMLALAVLGLVLILVVSISPKLFWLPMAVGAIVWLCGNFWISLGLEDMGRILQGIVALLPFGTIPMFIFYDRGGAIFYEVLQLVLTLALAVQYIFADRLRMLRPVGLAMLGALLVIIGFIALGPTEPPPPTMGVPTAPQF
jgi:hypothetical protein